MQMGAFDRSKKSRFDTISSYRQDEQHVSGMRSSRNRGLIEALRGLETGWLRKPDQKRALHEATVHLEENLVISGQLDESNCQVRRSGDTCLFACVF